MKPNPKLIPALRESGDFSPSGLKSIAEKLNVPISQVAGIATFYSEFNGMSDGEVDMSFAFGGREGAMFAPVDYERIKVLCSEREILISKLRAADLRGRGGSEYSIADKWEYTKNAPGEEKYIICNGSEGEGETYKDMKLMLNAPHAIIEGMLLCAAAVGAQKGFVYVRGEYPQCKSAMEQAVEEAKPYLGSFEIQVVGGAGSYVCGEETALIRAIVGKRSEPVLKPPFPGVDGIYHKPTIINNAESFAAVAEYFLTGEVTKLFTVSGCVKAPGVYELSFGKAVREIAELVGAENVKGFRLGGGATGRIYSAEKLDMVLNKNIGTASIMFFSDVTSTRQLAADSVEFLAKQSCGKCAPCRLGSVKLADLLGESGSREEIEKLCSYLRLSSRCGLGQSIPNTVESAMQAFPEEFN